MRDHRGIGGRSPDVIELEEENKEQDDYMFVDDIPKCKVVLKKPKSGCLENEVIRDNDNNFDSEIINSNVQKAIDKLDQEDLDVEKIMDYDEDNSSEKKYHDESNDNDNEGSADNSGVIPANNHDVIHANNHDVSPKVVKGGSNAGFMDEMRKRQKIEDDYSFYYNNPDYRPPNFGESQSEYGSSSLSSRAENNGNAHEESTSTNDYDTWRTKHDGNFLKFVSLNKRFWKA